MSRVERTRFVRWWTETGSFVVGVAVLLALIYTGIALTAFSYRHPELTQTQVMLRIVDALLWR